MPVALSKLEKVEQVPKQVDFDLNYFSTIDMDKFGEMIQLRSTTPTSFILIVRNSGNRVARFVKIRLQLVEYPGEENPILHSKSFEKLANEATIVFRGNSEWAIYPNDMETFPFDIFNKSVLNLHEILYEFRDIIDYANNADKQELLPLYFGRFLDIGVYVFCCTVWAEGLDKPIHEKIALNIFDSKKDARLDLMKKISKLKDDTRPPGIPVSR